MAERKWSKAPALPVHRPTPKSVPVPEWALQLIPETDKGYSLISVFDDEKEAKAAVHQLRRAAAQLDRGLRAPMTTLENGKVQLAIQAGPRKKVKTKAEREAEAAAKAATASA